MMMNKKRKGHGVQGHVEQKAKLDSASEAENQPREQPGFRKGYSTVDHLQAINQLIEKCNNFKRPPCIGYIDYAKAFDSIEHEAIFQALRSIGINETYITILEDAYTGDTARVHMNNQV